MLGTTTPILLIDGRPVAHGEEQEIEKMFSTASEILGTVLFEYPDGQAIECDDLGEMPVCEDDAITLDGRVFDMDTQDEIFVSVSLPLSFEHEWAGTDTYDEIVDYCQENDICLP